jgi:hypothetical protein
MTLNCRLNLLTFVLIYEASILNMKVVQKMRAQVIVKCRMLYTYMLVVE